jgi:SnoaL-like polyketide cyclase
VQLLRKEQPALNDNEFRLSEINGRRFTMSEEDLELLITLDDPEDAPEVDTFNHLHAKNTLEYWLGHLFAARSQLDQRAEAVSDNDANKVMFGQGDWTCTISRLTGTTNVSMKGGNVIEPPNKKLDIEVCTVTHWKNGEIVKRKVFYDLVGMQKQIGVR